MPYKKFRIKGYKGIRKDLVIDLEKSSLIPIIGINESGKTTILEAILSFDRFNDYLYGGRHLENVENMYSTKDLAVKVEAEVDLSIAEILERIEDLKKSFTELLKGGLEDDKRQNVVDKLESLDEYEQTIKDSELKRITLSIGRDLKAKKYYFPEKVVFENEDLNHDLLFELMKIVPYTLYFDDFRDRVDERIEIKSKADHDKSDWLEVIDRLFSFTSKDFSVYDLPSKHENIRLSILSEVQEKLNQELLREWPNFSVDNTQPLKIKISHFVDSNIHYLQFLIVEM